jgi:hypothetical protein
VRLITDDGWAVLEGRSAVVHPGHLEHAVSTLDTVHAEALAEPATLEIFEELRDRDEAVPKAFDLERLRKLVSDRRTAW